MKFDTEDLPQYLRDHEAIWPEMQEALVRCGWHNYSLFYRPDGFAIGYFETPHSFEEAGRLMSLEAVNDRWQSEMAKYTANNVKPDEEMKTLEHYFYLGHDQEVTPCTLMTEAAP